LGDGVRRRDARAAGSRAALARSTAAPAETDPAGRAPICVSSPVENWPTGDGRKL